MPHHRVEYIHNVDPADVPRHTLGHPGDCFCEPVCFEFGVSYQTNARVLMVMHQQFRANKKNVPRRVYE